MYIHKVCIVYGVATLLRSSALGNCPRLHWLITFIIRMRSLTYRVRFSWIETGNKDSSAAGHCDFAAFGLVSSRNEHAVFRINLIIATVRNAVNRYIENKQVTWTSAFTDLVNLKESLFRVKIAEVDSLKPIEHGSFCTALTDCDLRFFSTFYIGRCGWNLLRIACLIALHQSILTSHRKFHACLLPAFQCDKAAFCG